MNTANNQLRKDTDRRIRAVLLACLEQGKEPTVGELCKGAQINRSTFYRHYLDIYDLMEKTETEIQKGLAKTLERGGDKKGDPLERLVRYVGDYGSFYRIYLQKHLNGSMEAGFQSYWELQLKPLFLRAGVTDERRMMYYYQFVKAGVMTVLKLWLEDGCRESPEEIARVLRAMLSSSVQKAEKPGQGLYPAEPA